MIKVGFKLLSDAVTVIDIVPVLGKSPEVTSGAQGCGVVRMTCDTITGAAPDSSAKNAVSRPAVGTVDPSSPGEGVKSIGAEVARGDSGARLSAVVGALGSTVVSLGVVPVPPRIIISVIASSDAMTDFPSSSLS